MSRKTLHYSSRRVLPALIKNAPPRQSAVIGAIRGPIVVPIANLKKSTFVHLYICTFVQFDLWLIDEYISIGVGGRHLHRPRHFVLQTTLRSLFTCFFKIFNSSRYLFVGDLLLFAALYLNVSDWIPFFDRNLLNWYRVFVLFLFVFRFFIDEDLLSPPCCIFQPLPPLDLPATICLELLIHC